MTSPYPEWFVVVGWVHVVIRLLPSGYDVGWEYRDSGYWEPLHLHSDEDPESFETFEEARDFGVRVAEEYMEACQ